MKFLALFAAGAMAAGPLAARQGASDIATNVQTIADNTQALSQGVDAFDGSTDSVVALQQASMTLIESIQAATSALPTEELSPTEATELVPPFTALRDQVSDSIDGVIAAQQAFVDADVAGIVYDQLTQIRAASQALSDGIIALVPSGLQDIAQGLSDPILQDLDRGVSAFEQYAEQSGSPSDSASETATVTETESATETATVVPTGTVGTSSSITEPTPTGSLPPYDDNAAMPTAAAAYGAVGLAALAAIVAF